MASLLSPGVISREIDLTTTTPSVASTEGGIVINSQWGPAGKLVLVTDEVDLVDVFGKPNDSNAARWFTAKNFLSYSGALYVSRALGEDADGNIDSLNSASGTSGLLIRNEDDLDGVDKTNSGMFAAKYPGEMGNSLEVSISDGSTFEEWTHKSLFSEAPDHDQLHVAVIDKGGLFSGVKGTLLEKFEFVSKFSDAKNEDGTSNYYQKAINDSSEYVWSLNHPTDLIAWGGSESDFVSFDSTTGQASILLDDNGDAKDYELLLKYLKRDSLAGTKETYEIITSAPVAQNFTVGNVVSTKLTVDGVNEIRTGVVQSWSTDYVAPVADDPSTTDVNETVAEVPATKGTLVIVAEEPLHDGATLHYDAAATVSSGLTIVEISKTSSLPDDYNTENVTSLLYHSLKGGSDGTTPAIVEAYDLFSDEELVDISFLLAADGGQIVVNKVFDIVSSRQDCLGVISPLMDDVVNEASPMDKIRTYRNSLSVGGLKDLKGSFMVMDDNWKYQFDKYNNVNRWVPCNGDTAGLMAETDIERAAWFSPGGRGLKNVIKLAWKSKKAERDVLYPLGINSIATFPGEGAILYGDRTMLKRPSAFDRINVRRLFIVLRKTISRTARSFLFENNTPYTRERFKSTIIPFLEEVQGRQGITDFLVVCDESNNTGQVIDQNRFIGDIYIKPTRSINFIELNFVAVRTDVEFNEVVGSV